MNENERPSGAQMGYIDGLYSRLGVSWKERERAKTKTRACVLISELQKKLEQIES